MLSATPALSMETMTTMPAARDLQTPLGRARMLFSLLATPKLRVGLGARLSGAAASATVASEGPSVSGPLSRIDWLDAQGEVDLAAVREVADALTLMRSDRAILEVPPLDGIPVKTEESREVSGRIAQLVFERVGRDRVLSESELNAAIAMFVSDVALVRRDAVDSGVLTRTADGASYRLAEST